MESKLERSGCGVSKRLGWKKAEDDKALAE
jgi:hypothetical protein